MCRYLFPLVMLGMAGLALGQDERADPLALRYGLRANPFSYPQKTPQEALKAVVGALEKKRFDYLVAQLADPQFIDERVAVYRAEITANTEQSRTFQAFDRLQRETEEHYFDDPQLLRELRLFAREDAQWESNDDKATGTAKDVPDHKVFLRRLGERWFLENRHQ